jgi:DNA-binding LacI/PurR family transcriptional regulator
MVAGVDDIKYATYLRVPLTTYKQPCKDIAKVAIDLMMSRIRQPNQKARTVYLDGELIVRKSTGG